MIWNRLRYVLSPQFDIYEQVAEVVRGRVADIGFGTGFGAHLFTTNAKEIYGFEISESALRFAQRIFPFQKMIFQYGDIEKGLSEGDFNFVTMIDVIEHLREQKAAILNVKKMLAPNGTFICSTPNRLSRYRKSENHVKEFGTKEFESLLKMAFVSVSLRNYKLEPLASQYENPIIAVCRMIT